MKLVLLRSQQKSTLSRKITFSLQARVDLTEEEQMNVTQYKMGKEILYVKERVKHERRRYKEWWAIIRNLISGASMITINVNDMVKGKTFMCKDIVEMINIEEEVVEACEMFRQILQSAAHFDGEEIIEL